MTANPFGTLQVKGILNVNTTGFNCSAVTMTNNASRWFINNGGVSLFSNSVVCVAPGGILTLSGTLTFGGSVSGTAFGLVTSVSGSTLTLSWPTDHTGWRLQAQTNSLSTGLGTNWTDISGTETSNTYNATLNPANGTVFYRMVYL